MYMDSEYENIFSGDYFYFSDDEDEIFYNADFSKRINSETNTGTGQPVPFNILKSEKLCVTSWFGICFSWKTVFKFEIYENVENINISPPNTRRHYLAYKWHSAL